MQPVKELSFKFKYVRDGQATGLVSQKGVANDRELILGEESLSYDTIVDTTVRDKRLVLVLSSGVQLGKKLSEALIDGSAVVLEVYKNKAAELEKHIDRICSQREVEKNRKRLMAEGKEDLFQTETCPECQAIIDLSELDKTQYIYCRFCETVFTREQQVITKGSVYRVCDECDMFDRVRGYTEFYFYFLLIVYSFSYKKRYVCDNCANKIFLKTFFTNLIFILGIPSSIYLKVKSLQGRDLYLRNLAKANSLSQKGRYQEASEMYNQLHVRYPEHPGLLMNEGLGHIMGNDPEGGFHCLERSMKACSNYLPALQLMYKIQNTSKDDAS